MKSIACLLCSALLCLNASGAEADPKLEGSTNELRAVRDGFLDAVNHGDIERELTWLHTNVVVTWHNAEVSRGRDGVRAYHTRLTSGPQKLLEKFSAEINVDELVLHHDNTGIAFGSSLEHFQLVNGRSFDLKGRWTATLVRENDKWLIASLHLSTNVFDNVMLDFIKKRAFAAVSVVLIVGGAIGWMIGRRRRTPASPTVGG